MASVFLDFVFEQMPTLLIIIGGILFSGKHIHLCDQKRWNKDDQDSTESEESLSEMSEDETAIWFDGVDKKLIELHTRPKKSLVEVSGRGSLVTRTPLISYKAIVKRRNGKLEQKEKASTSTKGDKRNESKSESSSIPIKDLVKPTSGVTDELALDCEMVECYGNKSVLARVSIVNLFGHPILDSYAAPPSTVTDYRTRYSGIRKRDLDHAPTFEEVQAQVARLIKDKIVVGHAIHNDFAVLKLNHPHEHTRDTAKYFGRNYFLGKNPSLKKLSESVLGVKIQQCEHDSVQDAQATMKLYVTVREKWEETMLKKLAHGASMSGHNNAQKKKKQKTKPKKKKMKAFFVETI